MTAAVAMEPDTYPWLDWPRVAQYVDRAWDPLNAPHHSIIGLTGAGKSYLAINGILRPLCYDDRVLIIDTKQDDDLISGQGRPVKMLESDRLWKSITRRKEPFDQWQRLVVSDDRSHGQVQVRHALQQVYREGNWVVYLDEIRDITDPRDPGLGLEPWVNVLYRKGRSRRISVIAGTQSPAFVPRSFYDQASFAWIGRIRDEERQKRLREIGGMTKDALPIIAGLQRRQWLLSADNGEYFVRTKVTVRSEPR